MLSKNLPIKPPLSSMYLDKPPTFQYRIVATFVPWFLSPLLWPSLVRGPDRRGGSGMNLPHFLENLRLSSLRIFPVALLSEECLSLGWRSMMWVPIVSPSSCLVMRLVQPVSARVSVPVGDLLIVQKLSAVVGLRSVTAFSLLVAEPSFRVRKL